MIIHIVQRGETINSIANNYGISQIRLIQDNDLMNPDNLVVGQAIVIVYPKQIHIVQEGDTLLSIANNYNVTTMQLLSNNPYLLDRDYIYPGETIVISYADEKTKSITTNGYAYPYIDRKTLEKSLLYLTYLSVFNYTITADGELNDIEDIEIINLAKSYGVAPIMVISNVTEEGSLDREIVHSILTSQEKQNNLIENILTVLKTKGYYGLNLDMPYILPEDRQLYIEFISEITERLNSEGFKVFITITPNAFQTESGTTYEAFDFSALGQTINGVVILSYSWGYTTEIPIEATPFIFQQILLQYIQTQIPPEKIMIGITSIGYILEIPFIKGVSKADSISHTNAIQLASDVGAEIYYNSTNLSSYFYITNGTNYFVYFHDARAVNTVLNLVSDHGLQGVGIWNIMYFLAQTFLIINTQYNIDKVI